MRQLRVKWRNRRRGVIDGAWKWLTLMQGEKLVRRFLKNGDIWAWLLDPLFRKQKSISSSRKRSGWRYSLKNAEAEKLNGGGEIRANK